MTDFKLTHVDGADRMLIAVRLGTHGLFIRFADDREGWIPLAALMLPDTPRQVRLPDPHQVELEFAGTPGEGDERSIALPVHFLRSFIAPEEDAPGSKARSGTRPAALTPANIAGGTVGERIRALRNLAGMSQADLAGKAEVTRVTVARIEGSSQAPRADTLRALAAALDVPPAWLLG